MSAAGAAGAAVPSLPKGHAGGTHRAVPPEATLARVRPLCAALGITRLADVTGLDRVGIPAYCAIRPAGEVLQTTMGKGLRAVDAQVSALMEALEHWHAERWAAPPRWASAAELTREGERAVVVPDALAAGPPGGPPGDLAAVRWTAQTPAEWVPATELMHGGLVWIPASAVSIVAAPRLVAFSTNGLASGNHVVEASLHALYEVVERDAVTRLGAGGRTTLRSPAVRRVRLDTVGTPAVRALLDRIAVAGLEVVLLVVDGPTGVPTCWAALLDPAPFVPSTAVNFGYGAHLAPDVAAVRALTEAAQARLAYIHGAREDLAHKIQSGRTSTAAAFVRDVFRALPATLAWDALPDGATPDLAADLARLLGRLRAAGFGAAYRVDLTHPAVGVPVVKVLVPGARHNRRLF